jgi:hypothetical protein
MNPYLDIEIDRLTNSIEHSVTGEVHDTLISRVLNTDEAVILPDEWQFNWFIELYLPTRQVFKLTTAKDPMKIQGLISLEDKTDHVFIHLIESARFNQGNNKVYIGVAGNLFAFACKLSFDSGYHGFVAFNSKSALIEHYKNNLGATHFGGQRMFIDSKSSLNLVKKYFKSFHYGDN